MYEELDELGALSALDELAQGLIHGFALGFPAPNAKRGFQEPVVDVEVGRHTQQSYTH